MLRVRVIPALLLRNRSLVKTRRFRDFDYIGDPCNTLRIFNELEVDELVVLDICASQQGAGPDFATLRNVASECFMPLAYGGGLASFDQAAQIFEMGFEKVVINSSVYERPELITEIAATFGTQAVVASIDVGRTWWGARRLYSHSGRKPHIKDPVTWACELEKRGAGEILLTAIHREGTWSGFDIDLIREVSDAVTIPVIAQGGAAGVPDIVSAVRDGGASSVAVGSMVVYQKKDFGVLVNFPERPMLERALNLETAPRRR